MKKLMMILCTILCANILAAQTFTSGGLKYSVIYGSHSVQVTRQNSSDISGSVVIPSTVTYDGTTYSVTSIGWSAFYGCSSLTSVTIPTGVTSIESGAFSGCGGLTSINVASGNTHYSSIDGVLYNYVQDTLIQCPGAKTSITIPNSVTSIGNYAFFGCSGLTSITIPSNVTSIGEQAFWRCSGLTTLNFNAINCQDFEAYYNDDCPFSGTSLTTVNIGDSVQRIPKNFVRDCSGLTSVTIPTGVTSLGKGAFYGCSGLTTLNFNAIDCQDFEAYYYNGNYYYPFGTSLTTVNIGDSVQRIPAYFVRDCSSLTSVTIPNSVTSIGNSAFYGCSGLTTLNFNAIDCQNFEGYYYNGNYYYPFGTSLTTVNIGDSVQRIPAYFVRDCSSLTSVTIPNSVTSIGEQAFWRCSGLTTLNFNAINCQDFEVYRDYAGNYYYPFSGTSLTTVNIGDSVQRIPAYFVRDCGGLTSVTIPNSVTSIGNSAFENCSGLTSVTIPTGVTSIGGGAFRSCSSLTSVTIGNRVTSIGDRAFYECLNLSSLISLATVPPTIGNEAFPYPNICTVTVPCGSLAAYTASTCYWSVYFPQRITESSSFELSVSANDEAYGRVEVENHSCESKTLTAIANNGYEFTGWNDGNTENPRTVTVTSDTAFMAIFTEAVSTPTITVTVNDATMGSASYTMDGNTAILTATANEGYRFLTWNDGNMENPRTVTVTSDTAFMAIFTASGSSSLQEVNAREFAIYPNPAKSFVTLEFEALEENTLLQILDINGRRVRTLDLKAGQETLRIDLGDLPKGVYTVMIGSTTKKLIVE